MKQEMANGTFIDHVSGECPNMGYFDKGKARCDDGIIRTVRIHNVPDTYFTVRAKCQIKGHTVTGFVMQPYDSEELRFYGWYK